MPKIHCVKPFISKEKALGKLKSKELLSDDNIALVYYPYWIFYFKAELWRFLMKPRIVRMAVSVDGVTGKPARGGPEINSKGDLENVEVIDVSEDFLVELRVEEDVASLIAEKFVRRYMGFLFPGKSVKLSLERRELVYRPFWLIKMNNGVIKAVDAIDGEEITIKRDVTS
ncbi:MAG: hypothetical protein DRJ60_05065 [Thermoprotei archaeon]|nr:MAG: hypothetical protein DRJ60_05065 [Thermoprotei archaeon]